ncbi:hypothetical protein CONPUDRAFT_114144, partial [Coniophora puteana RWD-64-598 SS2]
METDSALLSDATSLSVAGAAPLRVVQMDNGVVVQFSEQDVSDPPAVSFAHDLPRLNAMWDHTVPHWQGVSELTIQRQPIPIKYWRDVYVGRDWKRNQWRGSWDSRLERVLVEHWRAVGPDKFWHEFSREGHRMPYTVIVKALQARRRAQNSMDVQHAREEFPDFEQQFGYRKGSQSHVMITEAAVARHYRQMKDQGSS